MQKSPNFLLFITDQHRADHLGAYGNSVVSTPNIDSLTEGGWLAERCYTASPVCMPNRASLLTGRWPSAHGARCNGIPLSLRARTFVEQLREAGYRTALVGKGHLQNMTGKPRQWPRQDDALETEAWQPDAGRYDQEWAPAWKASESHEMELPYYGFDDVDMVIDHGDQPGGHYERWLRRSHPAAAASAGQLHALPTPDYELAHIGQAWRTRLPEDLHPTAYIGEQTMQRLRSYANTKQPFFLQCSFADPHHPFTPPGRYWDMYDPAEMSLPQSFRGSAAAAPKALRWMHEQRAAGRAVGNTPIMFACTERQAREAIALNYGLITYIDSVVGSILRYLESSGLAQDTVVIFTSDHGDHMGDHQLLWKGPLHYQGITRVPFIWAEPKRRPGPAVRSQELLSTVDIAPTILDRAGVAPFNGIQGISALPLIRASEGAPRAPREAVLIEEEAQRQLFVTRQRMRVKTLVTRNHRLTIYDGEPLGELYDLAKDPDEMRDLWDDPDHQKVKGQILELMLREEFTLSEQSPYPSALA